MQAQTTGRIRGYRFNRMIFGALVGIGLATVAIFGIPALMDRQSDTATQELSPSIPVQADPPLPAGWVDRNEANILSRSFEQVDPPLPEGWVDPYFNRPSMAPVQADPPLPDGWVDPYFERAD